MVELNLGPGRHKVIGVMTGNSMDAIDVAIFEAGVGQSSDGVGLSVQEFSEIGVYSQEISADLRGSLMKLRELIKANNGQSPESERKFVWHVADGYHELVATAVKSCARKFSCESELRLVGIHGQTLAHFPPSIARGRQSYTVQLGNGAALSRVLKLPVVADFRSDDILNGGEGAPFAPVFNSLLLPTLGVQRAFFINAGNTSNISKVEIGLAPVGFDCGPCNHFVDEIVRTETSHVFDKDGELASQGRVIEELLPLLWLTAVKTSTGENGLALSPPRSFDPQWYQLPDVLRSKSGQSLNDRLRTVVAFSAVCIANAVASIGQSLPSRIVLFGGGWNNKLLLSEFKSLASGQSSYAHCLRGLPGISSDVERLNVAEKVSLARDLKLPDQGMEAGIFAFAAVQRVLDQPFSTPALTGCKSPTKCGVVFPPNSNDLSVYEPAFSRAAPVNQAALRNSSV